MLGNILRNLKKKLQDWNAWKNGTGRKTFHKLEFLDYVLRNRKKDMP